MASTWLRGEKLGAQVGAAWRKRKVLAGRTADAEASSHMLEMAVTTVAGSPS